ncbi:hypothetical protein P9D60_19895 [Bacillus spizizenii]|uniref:hypothetical protein n=1 Tax=Bacillus subtilis group TaxID=653685 RepID=UPI00165C8F88|nr:MULTISPECIES: hypothetical protein [Bacillus subtilis group]MCY8503929.1 hypothetical protein [Bacillus inaquosorum]MCY8844362.1 hypothetical protein [Bacillus inaquosorum]MEC1599716.1 hypothetical protein [Bacillus spizizenii]MEC1643538.1 hypothetical protein [Bacillus spizizenii]
MNTYHFLNTLAIYIGLVIKIAEYLKNQKKDTNVSREDANVSTQTRKKANK